MLKALDVLIKILWAGSSNAEGVDFGLFEAEEIVEANRVEAQVSTSLAGGLKSWPPLSVGLMIKTPMSCFAAASIAGQFVWLMKYQCRFT